MNKRNLRWRYLFIYVLLSLWLIAFVEIVVTHGGLKGNVEYSIVGKPPRRVLAYPDREPILFNRWLIVDEHKPYVLRALVVFCWPSFEVAGVFGSMLPKWNKNFAYAFPYGMSFDSYEYVAAFSVSLLQWFVIGCLADLAIASRKFRVAKRG